MMATFILTKKDSNVLNSALEEHHVQSFVHDGVNTVNKSQWFTLCESLAQSHVPYTDTVRAKVGSLWKKFQR